METELVTNQFEFVHPRAGDRGRKYYFLWGSAWDAAGIRELEKSYKKEYGRSRSNENHANSV